MRVAKNTPLDPIVPQMDRTNKNLKRNSNKQKNDGSVETRCNHPMLPTRAVGGSNDIPAPFQGQHWKNIQNQQEYRKKIK